jgi:Raf kinase inhibitor-like YbhB/YbcL family protein
MAFCVGAQGGGARVKGMMGLASLAAALILTSPAFGPGQMLPLRYTCDGNDVSPPLRWTAPPSGTRSLVLRLVDLDTHPQFRHWYVTGIPLRRRAIQAAARFGRAHRNDFGRVGYGGPCPPSGQIHHYLFQLLALDAHGRVVARARLPTTYRRR